MKVNITEKPIASSSSSSPDLSLLQSEDAAFVDSPYKVYVGNLAKSVTKEMLESLFSEKGKVLSAKVSRVPGTSKSTGFGFVTFSSDEDVEAAILALNNSVSCHDSPPSSYAGSFFVSLLICVLNQTLSCWKDRRFG